MTNDRGPGWNKIITVCSLFGLPLLGIAYAVVVLLTRIDDRLTNFQFKQQEQTIDIKDIKSDINQLKAQIDTVSRRQDNNQRDNDTRFLLYEHGIKQTK